MSETIKLANTADVDFDTVTSTPNIPEPEVEIDTSDLVSRVSQNVAKPPNTPERRALILKIQRYQIKFHKYLAGVPIRGLNDVENLSHEELENLLKELQLMISSRGNDEFFKGLYKNSICMAGAMAPMVAGIELPDLELLMDNPQLDDILTEISLETEIEYVSPWKRLAIVTASILTQSYSRGMMQRQSKVDPQVQQHYQDL